MTPTDYKLWFDALEPAMQRVVLAEEALALAKRGRVVPVTGDYSDFGYGIEENWKKKGDPFWTQHDNAPVCAVCEIGGLFAALFHVSGQAFTMPGCTGLEMHARLSKYFTSSQLELIESAFEMWNVSGDSKAAEAEAALEFGRRYATAPERYEAILCNIIHNDGEFRPDAPSREKP